MFLYAVVLPPFPQHYLGCGKTLGWRDSSARTVYGGGTDLLIMKDFAASFYKSTAWQHTRDSYARAKGNLCELCLKQGIYNPCEIVHHRIELTPDNINDPSITLAWSNLCCVCRECHAKLHGARPRRYKLDELGRVITTDSPPIIEIR